MAAISQKADQPAFIREVPSDGSKDWNELLHKVNSEEANNQEDSKNETAGLDIDNDGNLSAEECDERKNIRISKDNE